MSLPREHRTRGLAAGGDQSAQEHEHDERRRETHAPAAWTVGGGRPETGPAAWIAHGTVVGGIVVACGDRGRRSWSAGGTVVGGVVVAGGTVVGGIVVAGVIVVVGAAVVDGTVVVGVDPSGMSAPVRSVVMCCVAPGAMWAT